MSQGEQRADGYIKYVEYPPSLGLFLAGSVRTWRKVHASLRDVISDVNANNLADVEGVLLSTLNSAAISARASGDAWAIGFFLDHEAGAHRLFTLTVNAGNGCLYEPIGNFVTKVIGNGDRPEVRSALQTVMRRSNRQDPRSPIQLARALRNTLHRALGGLGGPSFQSLGISHFITLAIIEGSRFRMVGEECEGTYVDFDSHIAVCYRYQFFRNSEGQVVLEDLTTGRSRQLLNPLTDEIANWTIFDPYGLEDS